MLSFKNLSIGYHNPILENIDGELASGTITFLIGPNGSGKTTLLKTFSKIYSPIRGEISARETPIYLTSDVHFQSGITGNDLLDIYESRREERLLEYFDVSALLESPLENLSSGERQRILICAVLLNKSPIICLDEPLNHLDWNFALKLRKILTEQAQKGKTFIISNHDLNWALSFPQTQTWVLFDKMIFLKSSTASVLNDIKLQKVFKIKLELSETSDKKFISFSEL